MPNGCSRPRIAILTPYPADFVSFTGGVETATAGLLEGLLGYQDRFEFHVVTLAKELRRDLLVEREGFSYHFLSLPYSWQRPRLPFWILRTLTEIRRIAPHLIHCQDTMAMAIAATWSGRRRLFTIHGVKRHEASKRIGWERWSATADAWLEPYLYARFQDFVCISEYSRRIAGAQKRTYEIPNAVRSAFYEVRREFSPDCPLFLFVGVLSPLKRPSDLVSVHSGLCKRFPNLQTVFCGDAEDPGYKFKLQAMAAERVSFRGCIDLAGLIDLFAKATALVLPSAQENAPMVIAEAMAAGVPVVATDIGGVTEMVERGGSGFLYEPGDVNALASYLELLIDSPTLLHEMGLNARKKALARYHPQIVGQQIIEAYRMLLEDPRVKNGR